jgi:hypothetical protein
VHGKEGDDMSLSRCGVLLLVAACTVPQKRTAVEASMEDDERRAEAFEAVLRVLDEKPEYVDEFFRLAHERHPATLGRFLRDTVGALPRSERLTDWTAAELVRDPAALETILIATMDASAEREPAREAVARAVGARSAIAARALAEQPEVALEVMKELGAVGGDALVEQLRATFGE